MGAGYWGVALALVAERRGAQVLVIDDTHPHAASRNASAHFAFGWYKGEWQPRVRASFDAAALFGVELTKVGAIVNTPTHRQRGIHFGGRQREDWYTFWPSAFLDLRRADRYAEVKRVGFGWVELLGGEWIDTRRVAVCAGVWTDELLLRSGLPLTGVKSLTGAGVVFNLNGNPWSVADGRPVFLHEINPYKQTALRPWGPGRVRIGETSEAVANREPFYLDKMLAPFTRHLADPQPVEVMRGHRPLIDDGPTVKLVGRRIVAATGGGRIGALLAFWAAEDAWKKLE